MTMPEYLFVGHTYEDEAPLPPMMYRTADWTPDPAFPELVGVASVGSTAYTAAFDATGALFAVCAGDSAASDPRRIDVLSVGDWDLVVSIPQLAGLYVPSSVAFSPDGALLAATFYGSPLSAVVYDTATWDVVESIARPIGTSWGRIVQFSPDGAFLLVGADVSSSEDSSAWQLYRTSDWGLQWAATGAEFSRGENATFDVISGGAFLDTSLDGSPSFAVRTPPGMGATPGVPTTLTGTLRTSAAGDALYVASFGLTTTDTATWTTDAVTTGDLVPRVLDISDDGATLVVADPYGVGLLDTATSVFTPLSITSTNGYIVALAFSRSAAPAPAEAFWTNKVKTAETV